jgi:glycosyltransferase involved in cell wall biosynthesis
MSLDQWELLLIDNASTPPLTKRVDLTWHPRARVILEQTVGLTAARLRGIQESISELLVFVDDDNVLGPDFLALALQISERFPFLGAWGGQVIPEYESPPPSWFEPFKYYLTIRQFEGDHWSNLLHQQTTTPVGAGMCVRRSIATEYARLVASDRIRKTLDRTGTCLFSGGDTDFAYTACGMGLGTGQFHKLKLLHLIPSGRLTMDYVLRAAEAGEYSRVMLDFIYGRMPAPAGRGLVGKVRALREWCRQTPRQREVAARARAGFRAACAEVERLQCAQKAQQR